jgi:hypothetical protein
VGKKGITRFACGIKAKHENPHLSVCKELAHDPADGAAHGDGTAVDVDEASENPLLPIFDKPLCQGARLTFSHQKKGGGIWSREICRPIVAAQKGVRPIMEPKLGKEP